MTRPRVVIPAERMFAFPVSAKVQSGRPAEGAAAGNKALAVALAIVIAHAGHALAWGDEGHRIVAECKIARNSDPLRGGFRVQF